MRIIGGQFRGLHLAAVGKGDAAAHLRPTADRVRESIFNLLINGGYGNPVSGARVLDLFAGTGALGLEALSRGALRADFVETRPASLHALRANVAVLRLRERTRVFKRDALPFAAALTADTYDITFLDPPYGSRMLDRVLESWRANRFSRILAVEHAPTHELPAGVDSRRFAESALTIYRL